MSASLVGSEMCIRDSSWPMWAGIEIHVRRWARGRPDMQVCIVPAPVHVPVSYTHLTLPTICSV
eukprot:1024827-Alexandrium_andersonii.AAC.1